jgi:ABC-2 type transport system ATP-binding protein
VNGQTVIETQDLTKVYGEQVAVNRLNLKINQGEVFGFLGPNGAGKTTTLIMLLGLSEPTSGKARVCGFDPTREALKVKRVVGYLPENVGFYDDINAVQNLLFISRLNGIPDDVALVKIEELLNLVDLKPEPKKKVGEFSRGMRQRLGIAEVLLKDPRVVFLDEPTLGLDPDGSHQMLELIQSLSRDKKITVFFSSHLLDQVQKISTRIGIMLKGTMVAVGRIEDLAKEKLGLEEGKYTLEELYMKYFKEGQP